MCYGSLDEKLNPVIGDWLNLLFRSECQEKYIRINVCVNGKYVAKQPWHLSYNCLYSHYIKDDDSFIMPVTCI